MQPVEIAGIQRASLFSPNHVGNDAAIFMVVADYLKEKGYRVNTYTESGFLTHGLRERFVFTMLRNGEAVRKLQQLEVGGESISINSGFGIENCTREKMTRLLVEAEVPHPYSIIVNTGDPLPEKGICYPCWAKRGDFHAIHREDVSYIRNAEELQSVLSEYALRGIGRAVINVHLTGDLIKFYGVADTDFFYWFYPYQHQHSKFGLEEINGVATGIPFAIEQLHTICTRASQVLQIKVYGGDAVVDEAGNVRIIDFNDWPSFAPCRNQAAVAIGECIRKTIHKNL